MKLSLEEATKAAVKKVVKREKEVGRELSAVEISSLLIKGAGNKW